MSADRCGRGRWGQLCRMRCTAWSCRTARQRGRSQGTPSSCASWLELVCGESARWKTHGRAGYLAHSPIASYQPLAPRRRLEAAPLARLALARRLLRLAATAWGAPLVFFFLVEVHILVLVRGLGHRLLGGFIEVEVGDDCRPFV